MFINVVLMLFFISTFFVLFQGPLVGMNPVQIRVTADLYPGSRSAVGGGVDHPEIPAGWSPCSLRHKRKVSQGNLLTGSFFVKSSARSVPAQPLPKHSSAGLWRG